MHAPRCWQRHTQASAQDTQGSPHLRWQRRWCAQLIQHGLAQGAQGEPAWHRMPQSWPHTSVFPQGCLQAAWQAA